MRPICSKCAPFPKIADWPRLGPEQSGIRTCPVCGRHYHDGNLMVDSDGKPIKDPFDFKVAKTEDKEYMEWQT